MMEARRRADEREEKEKAKIEEKREGAKAKPWKEERKKEWTEAAEKHLMSRALASTSALAAGVAMLRWLAQSAAERLVCWVAFSSLMSSTRQSKGQTVHALTNNLSTGLGLCPKQSIA